MTAAPPDKPKKALMILGIPKDDGGPPPLKSPGDSSPDSGEPDTDDMAGGGGKDSTGQTCSGCWAFNGTDTCMHFPQYVGRDPQDWCAQFAAGKNHGVAMAPTHAEPDQDDQGASQANEQGGY